MFLTVKNAGTDVIYCNANEISFVSSYKNYFKGRQLQQL
jgi:hypothetical protein